MKYKLNTEDFDLPFDSIELNYDGLSIQIDQDSGSDMVGNASGWIWGTYRNADGWEIIAQSAWSVNPDGEVSVTTDHGAEIIRIDEAPAGVELGDLALALEDELEAPGEDELLSLISIEADGDWVTVQEVES